MPNKSLGAQLQSCDIKAIQMAKGTNVKIGNNAEGLFVSEKLNIYQGAAGEVKLAGIYKQ